MVCSIWINFAASNSHEGQGGETMKTPNLILLMPAMMLLATAVTAQEINHSSDPPDVSILQKSWSREVHYPGRNPNPLHPNEEYMRMVRTQKAVIKRREESLPNQTTEERMPVSVGPPLSAKMARAITYVYKIKVQNTSAKTIRTIFWEYQFLDPDTQEVMGHRRGLPVRKRFLQVRDTNLSAASMSRLRAL